MAITPVNLARVSFNFRAYNLSEAMRFNQGQLYDVQNQLATGYRFLLPSEDPVRAASAIDLDGRLDQLALVKKNLDDVNGVFSEVESSLQDAIDLLRDANTLSLQGLDDSHSADERAALAPVVDSILDQLVALGNKKYLNTYLFSGTQASAPFSFSDNGVLYSGDGNRRETIVDTDMSTDTFTVPGTEFFGAVSSEVQGVVDLDPAVTPDTRISDLRGTTGRGVVLGRVLVDVGGVQVQVDLSDAATVGDVADRLNAAAPGGLAVSVGPRGLSLAQTAAPTTVTISDVAGGTTARDLGIAVSFATPNRTGGDLDPRITPQSRIADLSGGVGLNLNGGLVIRNGSHAVTVNLTGVQTVEDVVNRLNVADAGVWARIGDDGRHLELRSRVSGPTLTVEENGGRVAAALGLRSLHGGTPLAALNEGEGVPTVDGDDLRITTRSGAVIDVDLDGATTIQDVIDTLRTAGGAALTVNLVATGNGIEIRDNTVGAGTLTVGALNASLALSALGLDVTSAAGVLRGRDVNPLRADSPFTALLDLRDGLRSDDRLLMQSAAARLERVMNRMERVQGDVASQAQMMSQRTTRVEAETAGTEALMSDVRDINFADAAVRFQQLQMALQANLSTAAQVMNMSLLDYLK